MTPMLADNCEGKKPENASPNSEKIHRSLQFRTLCILDHGAPKSRDIWRLIFPPRKLWLKQLNQKVLPKNLEFQVHSLYPCSLWTELTVK